MQVLTFLLAAMAFLQPGRDHQTNAAAMALIIEREPPLFRDDETKRKTAALLAAVSFRESSFRNEAESQTGDSCLLQIHLPAGARTREGWSGADLRADVTKCLTVGFRMLRESVRICPKAPIAWYAAGGTGACTNARALRISRDRMWLAQRLARDVLPDEPNDS